MEKLVKLIYRSNMTYLPTKLPVQFYGLPDGKVYLIYARFYEIEYDRTYLEYVIAEHKEFSYDYHNEKLIPRGITKTGAPVYSETVDKPEPKFKILEIYRNVSSFAEAYNQLNKRAHQIAENMMMKKERKIQQVPENSINRISAIA